MTKDTLKKGIKCFVMLILFKSCDYKTKQNSINNLNRYVEQNFNANSEIYNIINDSIYYYLDSGLLDFKFIYRYEWRIDSMLCINTKGDKLITTINKSNGKGKNGVSDIVSGLLGKKINGNWYFFEGGGTLVVPRNMYGKDVMHPLSFYELSQIARKEMLAGAVIEKNGKLIIDDEWIDEHFYNGGYYSFGKHRIEGIVQADEVFQMPRDKAKFDSVHWQIIMDKWKHKIDTIEYKPLQRKQFKKVNSPQ